MNIYVNQKIYYYYYITLWLVLNILYYKYLALLNRIGFANLILNSSSVKYL